MRAFRNNPVILLALCAFLFALVWAPFALAQERVALVIGNDHYPNLPADKQIAKAVNDAKLMADPSKKQPKSLSVVGNAHKAYCASETAFISVSLLNKMAALCPEERNQGTQRHQQNGSALQMILPLVDWAHSVEWRD